MLNNIQAKLAEENKQIVKKFSDEFIYDPNGKLKQNINKKQYGNGKYEGMFKNNLREGKGIIYRSNGNVYVGEWKDDCRCGEGIFIHSSGQRYEGQYKNNAKEGHGIYFFEDGSKYDGNFKNNKIQGYGVMKYDGNKSYKGSFQKNLHHGYGVLTVPGGKLKATWFEGIYHGKGIWHDKENGQQNLKLFEIPKQCIICLQEDVEITNALIPCGHSEICDGCFDNTILQIQKFQCPTCREPIKWFVKIS